MKEHVWVRALGSLQWFQTDADLLIVLTDLACLSFSDTCLKMSALHCYYNDSFALHVNPVRVSLCQLSSFFFVFFFSFILLWSKQSGYHTPAWQASVVREHYKT